MSQPTSIQMLDTAIWKELGVEEVAESEAFDHALATLLSRWLLARSEYPEMEAIKLFAKVRAYVVFLAVPTHEGNDSVFLSCTNLTASGGPIRPVCRSAVPSVCGQDRLPRRPSWPRTR
jgi:hypothetical protein